MEGLLAALLALRGISIWFIVCFCVFVPLSYLSPNIKGQPIFRKGYLTDALYWLTTPFFQTFLTMLVVIGIGSLFFADQSEIEAFRISGFKIFASADLWLQFFVVLFLTNIIQYVIHRWFHAPMLWPFHSIHHSSHDVDWLSTARFHPVNAFVYSTLTATIVYLLGFSPSVYALQLGFNVIFGAMVHANLNWTFGPFKYAIASPVFHRWHHTLTDEGGEKNFAPIFPIIDVLFGTFHMPKSELPKKFGTTEIVPDGFLSQMAYPFRRKE